MPERDEELGAWMREHCRRSFGPGFEGRVMRQIAGEPAGAAGGLGDQLDAGFGLGIDAAIAAFFPRLAAASLAVLLTAGLYAIWGVEDRSALEALVGMSPVSIDSAYDLGEDLVDDTVGVRPLPGDPNSAMEPTGGGA